MPPGTAASRHRRRLWLVFAITLTFVAVEVAGGLVTGSLALFADAGHLFTDVAGIGISLFAMALASRPATDARTFGMYRAEILAAMVNAMLLFGVAVAVLVEAWRRFQEPPEIAGGLMLAVALAGGVANAASLRILREGQGESLNVRGAYLEVLGDLLGSVAVVVAAIVIGITDYRQADPIASVLIGLLILPRTWRLLRDAMDVLLEATPKGIDLDVVRAHIVGVAGAADVHDLHAWTITSGMNVISAHVVLEEGADPPRVLDELCACLSEDFDIEHSTFQLESRDRRRLEETAHP
ncbi:MAG TPA: cation diffusion facilitator family transporter [Actinomycetota bacterium]|nr:cation diffusion facilitator family transporter [Actinomycetota bacterium]